MPIIADTKHNLTATMFISSLAAISRKYELLSPIMALGSRDSFSLITKKPSKVIDGEPALPHSLLLKPTDSLMVQLSSLPGLRESFSVAFNTFNTVCEGRGLNLRISDLVNDSRYLCALEIGSISDYEVIFGPHTLANRMAPQEAYEVFPTYFKMYYLVAESEEDPEQVFKALSDSSYIKIKKAFWDSVSVTHSALLSSNNYLDYWYLISEESTELPAPTEHASLHPTTHKFPIYVKRSDLKEAVDCDFSLSSKFVGLLINTHGNLQVVAEFLETQECINYETFEDEDAFDRDGVIAELLAAGVSVKYKLKKMDDKELQDLLEELEDEDEDEDFDAKKERLSKKFVSYCDSLAEANYDDDDIEDDVMPTSEIKFLAKSLGLIQNQTLSRTEVFAILARHFGFTDFFDLDLSTTGAIVVRRNQITILLEVGYPLDLLAYMPDKALRELIDKEGESDE